MCSGQADRAGTRYKGTAHAFGDIVRTEGVRGLWKGWGPNVQRAYIVNAVELATYDQAKQVGTLGALTPLHTLPDAVGVIRCTLHLYTHLVA